MDPILRRSSLFYLTTFVIYNGVLGRFLGRDAWPAFEAIPLFMPAYLLTAVVASEKGESYAFLRTFPIADARIVRTKFGLIVASALLYWAAMSAIALARMGEGVSSPATLVYITLVCGAALVTCSGLQIGIWRFGYASMTVAALVIIAVDLAVVLVHAASLRRVPDWPVLARTGPLEWMGGAPWLSIPALLVLFAAAAAALMRVGVRVKEKSEAVL